MGYGLDLPAIPEIKWEKREKNITQFPYLARQLSVS